MPDPKITFPGGAFTVSGYAPSFSLGQLGQCKLGDTFQITPPPGLKDIQVKAGIHVIDCTWGRKGSLWLEQSLTAGGTFSFANGAGGSMALNNQLFWTPIRELYFTFSFTLNGNIDQHGAHGTINFGSQFKLIDTPAGFAGAGFHF